MGLGVRVRVRLLGGAHDDADGVDGPRGLLAADDDERACFEDAFGDAGDGADRADAPPTPFGPAAPSGATPEPGVRAARRERARAEALTWIARAAVAAADHFGDDLLDPSGPFS